MDRRLLAIADRAGKSDCILDVGTDHGYLAVYLVESHLAKRAIVSDISKDSLQKAQRLIMSKRLTEKIDSRLGSGLDILQDSDYVDKIVIAGMGGNLISDIILSKKEYLKKNQIELILQPMQNPEILRKNLLNNGFSIVGEFLVEESHKIYQIINAILKEGVNDREYSGWDLEFGNRKFYTDAIQKNLFGQLVQKRMNELSEIHKKISSAKPKNHLLLINQCEEEMKELQELLK